MSAWYYDWASRNASCPLRAGDGRCYRPRKCRTPVVSRSRWLCSLFTRCVSCQVTIHFTVLTIEAPSVYVADPASLPRPPSLPCDGTRNAYPPATPRTHAPASPQTRRGYELRRSKPRSTMRLQNDRTACPNVYNASSGRQDEGSMKMELPPRAPQRKKSHGACSRSTECVKQCVAHTLHA